MPACTEARISFVGPARTSSGGGGGVGQGVSAFLAWQSKEFDDVGPIIRRIPISTRSDKTTEAVGAVSASLSAGALTRAQMAQWIGRLGDNRKPYDYSTATFRSSIRRTMDFGVSQIIAPMPFTNTLYDTNLFKSLDLVPRRDRPVFPTHDARLLVFVDEIDEAGAARLTIGKQGGCSGSIPASARKTPRSSISKSSMPVSVGPRYHLHDYSIITTR